MTSDEPRPAKMSQDEPNEPNEPHELTAPTEPNEPSRAGPWMLLCAERVGGMPCRPRGVIVAEMAHFPSFSGGDAPHHINADYSIHLLPPVPPVYSVLATEEHDSTGSATPSVGAGYVLYRAVWSTVRSTALRPSSVPCRGIHPSPEKRVGAKLSRH